MKRGAKIIYVLDTIVAVESSAILVAGCFGGLAVWQKVTIWAMATVAIWRMAISIEREFLRGFRNEKSGKGTDDQGAVQRKPWYTVRLRESGKAHRNPGRRTETV